MKKPQIKIIPNKENPEPIELIAKSIIDISNAFEKIQKSGLNRRALTLLIADHSGVSFSAINKVLNTVPLLKDIYLKKK